MLRVYTYCSYRSSPVGFCLGVIDMDSEPHEYLFPSVPKVTSAKIKEYFSGGLMNDCFGGFQERGTYTCVVKSLEKEFYNEDGMLSKKYGNFAFETDRYDEYKRISINLKKMGKDRLNEYMDQFLIPDSSVPDVALKIQTEAFKDFIRQLLKDTEDNIPGEFQLEGQQKDPVKVSPSMHNNISRLDIIKKKRSKTDSNRNLNIKVLLGTAAGVIILLIILLII